jgi:hypothetical protein
LQYPKPGEPNSFQELQEAVVAMGCSLSLKGRADKVRRHRWPVLTVKGPTALQCFHYVYHRSRGIDGDWSRTPLPSVALEDRRDDAPATVGDEARLPEALPEAAADDEELRVCPDSDDDIAPWDDVDFDPDEPQQRSPSPTEPPEHPPGLVLTESLAEVTESLVVAGFPLSPQQLQQLTDMVPPQYKASLNVHREDLSLAGDNKVSFCLHCFRRGFQLKQSLIWNLSMAWPFRRMVSFNLVLFNQSDEDTKATLQWLATYPLGFIQAGYLNVFLAGDDMRFWHASICKNTSHKAAMSQGDEASMLLCNLDVDNGFSADFVPSLVKYAQAGRQPMFIQYKGDDGGVTGRMAYWAEDFRRSGGYDEGLSGSGYQDIDLRNRFRSMLGDGVPGNPVVNGLNRHHRKFSAGWSFPNDPSGDMRASLDKAKIANCDPAEVRGKSWGSMNGRNMALACAKQGYARNESKGFEGCGCQDVRKIDWHQLKAWAEDGGGAPPRERGVGAAASSRPRNQAAPGDSLAEPLVLLPKLAWGSWAPGERVIDPPRHSLWVELVAPQATIRMVTMGLAVAGDVFGTAAAKQLARRCMGQERGPLPEEDLARQVIANYYQVPERTAIVMVDTRMMHDPETGSLRRHLGFNPHIIKAFVLHPQFRNWVRVAMRKIVVALRTRPEGEVWVVCYCRKGKHRSVAGATVLTHFFQSLRQGPQLGLELHTSAPLLWPRMCGPPGCVACTRQNSARSEALAGAREFFRLVVETE